ncbi:MAG: hypothetical protein AAGB04_20705 [Pseudomonadota bacterium]
MNELILAAQDAIEFDQMALFDVGLDINDYLLSAIAENPRDGYGKPRDAFLRMLRNEAS